MYPHVFLDYLKEVLPPDTFEAFLHGSIFDKTAVHLGEKQAMLVNNKCRLLWYNRVGIFSVTVWDRRNRFYTAMEQHA